jgi:hypothetical protein
MAVLLVATAIPAPKPLACSVVLLAMMLLMTLSRAYDMDWLVVLAV